MLRNVIKLNLDDLWLCFGGVGAVFLLVHIITGIVLAVTRDHSAPMISGATLPCAAGFILMCCAVSHVHVTFQQALRFGQTRRRSLGLYLGLMAFEGVCTAALALVLTLAERALAPALWLKLTGYTQLEWGSYEIPAPSIPGAPSPDQWANALFVKDFALDWYWWPIILLGGLILGLLIGAFTHRFGKRAVWILWGIWMLICFAPQLLPWDEIWFTLPWQYLAVAGGVATVVCLGWSIRYLLRCPVRN